MRALLLLLVVLSGCLAGPQPHSLGTPASTEGASTAPPSGSTAAPSPTTAPPGSAWPAWAGPMAAQGMGYGFIAVDKEGFGPALPFVAVDRQGNVLWFKAAHNPSAPAGSQVTFAPGLERWRSIVAPLLEDGVLFGRPGHAQAKVTEVRSASLTVAEWEASKAAIEQGLATAREPRDRDPQSQVVDGGTVVLVAGERNVTLDHANDDGGGGWADVDEELTRLRQWIAPE